MSVPPIPLQTIKGWFFDLDGTLMDTDDQAVDSLAGKLRLIGDQRAQKLARRLVMMGETPMNRMLTMADIVGLDRQVLALRRRLSMQVKPTFRIVKGVKPLLEQLARLGNLAVVSTRLRQDAALFLRQHELESIFPLCVTQETTPRLKPHPQPVAYAVHHFGLEPSDCVMVGDTPVDMLAARRAGAWAIGVLCGFGEEVELRRAGAHLILTSTAELLPLVARQRLGPTIVESGLSELWRRGGGSSRA